MSADTLKLTILSPERRLSDQVEVQAVTLPTSEGQVQVLPGHAAMIGSLVPGVYSYVTGAGAEESGFVSTGFFEVRDGKISLMAETLELKGEIDLERARTAQKKAETALLDADLDEQKFRKYQLKLQRALVRQQFATKSTH
jgi:F-type H+-transporting ATPase subunit epsilon